MNCARYRAVRASPSLSNLYSLDLQEPGGLVMKVLAELGKRTTQVWEMRGLGFWLRGNAAITNESHALQQVLSD